MHAPLNHNVLLRPTLLLGVGMFLVFGARSNAAVPSAETLLPQQTVGFLAIGDVPDFRERWDRTQIGHFCNDPSMGPFVKQVRRSLVRNLGDSEERLGVTLEELGDVATGEAALGVIPQAGEDIQASVAMLADVTGNGEQAKQLLQQIRDKLVERGATRNESTSTDGLVVYQVPATKKRRAHAASYFLDQGLLVAVDNPRIARDLLTRLRRPDPTKALVATRAYKTALAKARRAASGMPSAITWFVDPFLLDDALQSRALPQQEDTLPEKKRMLSTLREEGFDAITGLGGRVAVAPDAQRDFVHHSVIYTPAKPGTEGKPAAQRYSGAMRMFELANTPADAPGDAGLGVQPWAPRSIATYKTVNVDILNAFDHLDSLFNAMAGYPDAFQSTLDGFEKDPYGPKIKLRSEVIANLGPRVTVLTDYTTPITVDCERYLIVFDRCNGSALREPLDKLMESDGAMPRELNGISYWETVAEESVEDLDAGLLPFDEPVDEQRETRVLQRAAVCLHEDQLVIGSDVEFLKQALFGIDAKQSLGESLDLQMAREQVNLLAPGPRCSWVFTRTDEAIRPSYELLREGKMPQAETFFGRLLNEILTTEEQNESGEVRQQKIDGKTLPPFALARRYFGPSARTMRTDDDGWLLTGVILNKAAE